MGSWQKQIIFSCQLDQSGFLKKGPTKVHVLYHREFKTEAWNSFTTPLLKQIPVMIQAQKMSNRSFPGQHHQE